MIDVTLDGKLNWVPWLSAASSLIPESTLNISLCGMNAGRYVKLSPKFIVIIKLAPLFRVMTRRSALHQLINCGLEPAKGQ
jgi:hypothetical protein